MNQLVNRHQFESILANYSLSEKARLLLKNIRLVLLSGPTAVGRNTIIDQLIKNYNYSYIVSDTTRKPRINNGVKEVDGVTYWFRTEESFIKDLKAGEYLEAEIIHDRQVSGISIRELKRIHELDKVAITEVEIGGFINILNIKPDTIGIFVLPPSFDKWLDRLYSRSQMPKEEIVSRLKTAKRIFEAAISFQNTFIVVNDDLDIAVGEIEKIIKSSNFDQNSIRNAKLLATKLLRDTDKYLNDL